MSWLACLTTNNPSHGRIVQLLTLIQEHYLNFATHFGLTWLAPFLNRFFPNAGKNICPVPVPGCFEHIKEVAQDKFHGESFNNVEHIVADFETALLNAL